MVDSISSNMATPVSGLADAAASQQRPEPAVQVTRAEAGRHGGNATTRQGGAFPAKDTAGSIEDAFEQINDAMQAWSTGMRFELDDDTQQMVVSIINTESGEVLRQIPSEEVLHVAKMIAQFQGKLVNTKA